MKKQFDEENIIEWLVIPILIMFAFAIWWFSSVPFVTQEETATKPETTQIVENSVESVENTTVETTTEPPYIEKQMILTAYCSCVRCCGKSDGITASGTKAKQGRTVAVDTRYIPYGTEIIIDGMGTYIAEDCGGAIKGENKIDLFFDNHEEALEFGVQKKVVRVML
jgi:3D (Asp-Asp-Asp) domain-containing protein